MAVPAPALSRRAGVRQPWRPVAVPRMLLPAARDAAPLPVVGARRDVERWAGAAPGWPGVTVADARVPGLPPPFAAGFLGLALFCSPSVMVAAGCAARRLGPPLPLGRPHTYRETAAQPVEGPTVRRRPRPPACLPAPCSPRSGPADLVGSNGTAALDAATLWGERTGRPGRRPITRGLWVVQASWFPRVGVGSASESGREHSPLALAAACGSCSGRRRRSATGGAAGPGRALSPFAARDSCMRKWARGRDSRVVCSGAGSSEDGCPLRAAGESCSVVGRDRRGGAGAATPLRGFGRLRG